MLAGPGPKISLLAPNTFSTLILFTLSEFSKDLLLQQLALLGSPLVFLEQALFYKILTCLYLMG